MELMELKRSVIAVALAGGEPFDIVPVEPTEETKSWQKLFQRAFLKRRGNLVACDNSTFTGWVWDLAREINPNAPKPQSEEIAETLRLMNECFIEVDNISIKEFLPTWEDVKGWHNHFCEHGFD